MAVTFRSGRPTEEPAAVTWFPKKACANVRQEFCTEANVFCCAEHLEAWEGRERTPAGRRPEISETTALAPELWARLRPATDQSSNTNEPAQK